MGSISSVTPFFTRDVSSSLTTSSNVKPYWKPEQPPPVTNTRSFKSALPSSSIRAFTFSAALSVKISGAGISVMSFIVAPGACSLAPLSGSVPVHRNPATDGVGQGCGWGSHPPDGNTLLRVYSFQFDHRGRSRFGVIETPLNDGAHVHLQRLVGHITRDLGLRLQLQIIVRSDRAVDASVDHDMRDTDLALYPRLLADHERARFAVGRYDTSADFAIDPQAAGEVDVTLNHGTGADEAVDPLLWRRVLLALEHGVLLRRSQAFSSPADSSGRIRRRGPLST